MDHSSRTVILGSIIAIEKDFTPTVSRLPFQIFILFSRHADFFIGWTTLLIHYIVLANRTVYSFFVLLGHPLLEKVVADPNYLALYLQSQQGSVRFAIPIYQRSTLACVSNNISCIFWFPTLIELMVVGNFSLDYQSQGRDLCAQREQWHLLSVVLQPSRTPRYKVISKVTLPARPDQSRALFSLECCSSCPMLSIGEYQGLQPTRSRSSRRKP